MLGRDEYCERQKRLGGGLDGGHAQYCAVPAANLQRIPDWMDFDEAATLPLPATPPGTVWSSAFSSSPGKTS